MMPRSQWTRVRWEDEDAKRQKCGVGNGRWWFGVRREGSLSLWQQVEAELSLDLANESRPFF